MPFLSIMTIVDYCTNCFFGALLLICALYYALLTSITSFSILTIGANFLSLPPLAAALSFSDDNLVLEEARFFFFFFFFFCGSVSLMVGFDFSVMVVVLGRCRLLGLWVAGFS